MSDPTLQDYEAMYAGLLCAWDRGELRGPINHYNHEGGVAVSGFEMRQWLSMQCVKCRYDWSLRKLPYLQEAMQRYWQELSENGLNPKET